MLTPTVPTSPVQTYFVELQLKQNGTLVDRNVYWLSTQPDVVSWNKTLGQPQGTISQYANLTGLQTLPQSSVTATASTVNQAGPGGRGPGHHGHHHQHVLVHGRVPAPGGCAARHRRRPGIVRRQRAAVLALAQQRHHAVPRRVADAHRHLELRRPAGRHCCRQRVRAGTSPRSTFWHNESSGPGGDPGSGSPRPARLNPADGRSYETPPSCRHRPGHHRRRATARRPEPRTAAAAATYTPLPAHVYAPYYETYLAPNTPSITATEQASGAKYYTLAFLQSTGRKSCSPGLERHLRRSR